MNANWNWLQDTHDQSDRPVFAGQKLVVVDGSSGMGRQAAALGLGFADLITTRRR